MKYNKLVRDKIPERIRSKNQIPIFHIAKDDEYWEKLKEKLHEEIVEFLEKPSDEELIDILEVIDAIKDFKKIKNLNSIKRKKRKLNGAFKKKIILDGVKG